MTFAVINCQLIEFLKTREQVYSAAHLDVNFRLFQIPVGKIVAADSAGGAFDDANIEPVRLSLPVLDI